MNSKRCLLTLLVLMLAFSYGGAQNLLDDPEGVVYDADNNRYLVANWGDGSIIEIDSNGVQSTWASSLGNCANMLIQDTMLWVCTTNRYLRGLDLSTGTPLVTLTMPNNGLHDVCADTSGYLYATCWNANLVYRYDLSDLSFESYITSGLWRPLGILFDDESNRLLICSFDGHDDIQAFDLNTETLSTVVTVPFTDLDDLAKDTAGNYYVTNWSIDAVWKYDHAFTNPPELVWTGTTSMTDICYNAVDHEIAVTHYTRDSISFVPLADLDADDVLDFRDNCPNTFNPEQTDDDEDDVGNLCDNCPQTANTDQANDDADSLGNACDNCPTVTNPEQTDVNGNLIGDDCESCCGFWSGGYTGNVNQDTEGKVTLSDITIVIDLVYISKQPFECPENANTNGSVDGLITLSDISRMIDQVYISKGLTELCP